MKRFEENMDNVVESVKDMCEDTKNVLNIVDGKIRTGSDCTELNTLMEKIRNEDGLIEEDCIRILMLYQPTASDIRIIATSMKMITYLERISKYGFNTYKILSESSLTGNSTYGNCIMEMMDTAREMLEIVVSGFENKSTYRFDDLEKMDDSLDDMRQKILKKCTENMANNPSIVDISTDAISISRYLERIGDHTCKIGEKVTFMVTGKRVEIDQ